MDEQPFLTSPCQGDDRNICYQAEISGQSTATVVQFYVESLDSLGATSTFPDKGQGSRALYVVQDGQTGRGLAHNFRLVMLADDDASQRLSNTNLMSNQRIGATVIYNETEIFYDVGVRLKSSTFGRQRMSNVGYNIRFDPEYLFRGVHQSVAIDRLGGLGATLAGRGRRETHCKPCRRHRDGSFDRPAISPAVFAITNFGQFATFPGNLRIL